MVSLTNLGVFPSSTKAQTTSVSPESGCVREPEAYISPGLMATMASSGAFEQQGIPGGLVFETEFKAGNISASKIVQAAVKACILSNKFDLATHENYIEEVKNQIQLDIRDDDD